MHSILHKILIKASPEKLYEALNTQSGLTNWWTKSEWEGDKVTFYFGPNGEHQVTMGVISAIPAKEVRWQCVAGPWEDKGEFAFSIIEDEAGAYLDFAHHGWQETDDFYKHCNPKWGFFLAVSLKQYLETGTGLPHPNDPDI